MVFKVVALILVFAVIIVLYVVFTEEIIKRKLECKIANKHKAKDDELLLLIEEPIKKKPIKKKNFKKIEKTSGET